MQPTQYTIDLPNPPSLSFRGPKTHEMAYVEWGDRKSEQVVLCLHGLTRNGRDFDYLARDLAERGCRVLCPDMPGRGKSAWLRNPKWYNYPQYTADVAALLGTLTINQVDIVGTSMGGLISMFLASGMKQLVRRLVINDIGPLIPKEAIARIGEYVGAESGYGSRQEAEAALRVIMEPFDVQQEEHWQHIFMHMIVQREEGSWAMNYDPDISAAFRTRSGKQKKIPDVNLWKFWNKITCPVLVLRGVESDILPHAVAEKMAQREVVELIEFAGVGHAPMLMEGEQISVVREWLMRS